MYKVMNYFIGVRVPVRVVSLVRLQPPKGLMDSRVKGIIHQGIRLGNGCIGVEGGNYAGLFEMASFCSEF